MTTDAIATIIVLVFFFVLAIIAQVLLAKHVTAPPPAAKAAKKVTAIFLCSPYRGEDMLMNIDYARRTAREIQLAGGPIVTVFAPHLHTPQYLNDQVPHERDLGISAGCAIMARFDEVWFCFPAWRRVFSEGMRAELATAKDLGLRARIFHTEAHYLQALADLRAMSDRDAKVSA